MLSPPIATTPVKRISDILMVFIVIWLSFTAMAFWSIDFNIYRLTETGTKILKDEISVEGRLLLSGGLGLVVAMADTVIIAYFGLFTNWLRKPRAPASADAATEHSTR